MLHRRRSNPLFSPASKLLWPALALGILAITLRRRSRVPAPMPRLPVRRKPPSSSRLRRLNAPPPEVDPPGSFWDARDARAEDDPAEIPVPSSPLVSEASRAAAGVEPGAFCDAALPLRW